MRRTAEAVADAVASAPARDENVLVLGGDCTIELGTVAGALRDARSVGLVYVDLDVDLTTPETSDGAFDQLSAALEVLLAAPNRRCLTLTEVNPDHAAAEAETFGRLIRMLARTMGSRPRDEPSSPRRRPRMGSHLIPHRRLARSRHARQYDSPRL